MLLSINIIETVYYGTAFIQLLETIKLPEHFNQPPTASGEKRRSTVCGVWRSSISSHYRHSDENTTDVTWDILECDKLIKTTFLSGVTKMLGLRTAPWVTPSFASSCNRPFTSWSICSLSGSDILG
jgi:hypothetical protein